MAVFSVRDVLKLAELAHLSLSEDEAKNFAHQLQSIVEYAESIQELDTENISLTSHPLQEDTELEGQVSRRDEVKKSLDRTKILDGAPEHNEILFEVPKVLP